MVSSSILWLDRCASTNDEASKYLRNREYSTVVAQEQSKGRGRMGREWHSPPGCGLYLSHIIYPEFSQELGGTIPLMAGIVVAELCERIGVSVQLKWPNDVLIGTRKLAGILCEAQGTPKQWTAVVGIGLNLRTPKTGWPLDIPGIALDEVCGDLLDPRKIATRLVSGLNERVARIERDGPSDLFQAWSTRGIPIGTRIRRGVLEGTFAGLSDEGALRIQTTEGMETIHAGDVDIIRGE